MQFIRRKRFNDQLYSKSTDRVSEEEERNQQFARLIGANNKQKKDVKYSAFHYADQMLTIGLSDGSFFQYRKKQFDQKHFLVSKEHQLVKFTEVKTWHKGEVTCLLVEMVVGAKFIFTGSYDRTIKIWENDPKTKACIQTLFGHNGTIISIAFCNDTLFSASNDKTLKIWKQESGREFLYHPWFVVFQVIYDFSMKKSLNHQSYITCFLGRKVQQVLSVYAGDTDGSLHVIRYDEDVKKSQQFDKALKIDKSYFSFHRTHVIQIIEIEKDNAIFTIGYDQKIFGFSENGGKFFTYKNPHKCLFTSLQWLSTHQELVVSDEEGRIYFMNISSDKQVLEFKLYDCKILHIQVIENLDRLLIYSDQFIDIVEIKRGVKAVNNAMDQHKGPIIGMIIIEFPRIKNQYSEPDKLISASLDNTIRVWEPKDMTSIQLMECGEKNEIASMHYLQSANLLVTGHDSGEIRLWNIEIGSHIVLDQTKLKAKHVNTVCALASNLFPSGEEFLFTSGYDGIVNVWEIFERKQRLMASYIMPQLKQSILVKPKSHLDAIGYEILCLIFDRTTNCIIAAGNEGCIYFIEMLTYEHRLVFRGHTDSIQCLAIDGQILFSGSQDKTIRLWDTLSCQFLTSLQAHDTSIQSLIILPDTGHLVSIGQQILLVWDYPNSKVVSKIKKQETMRSIAYLQAERTIFIGTEEFNIQSIQLDELFADSELVDKQQLSNPSYKETFQSLKNSKKFLIVNSDGGQDEEFELQPSPSPVKSKKKTQIFMPSQSDFNIDNLQSNDFLRQLEEKNKQVIKELTSAK